MKLVRLIGLSAILLIPASAFGQGAVSGSTIPARYGQGSLLATQTRPTGYGDNQSELNQLFGRYDGSYLRLGITGNLQTNTKNGIVVLLDTKTGGNNPFNCTAGDDVRLKTGLTGDTFDTGFNPDYAIDTNVWDNVLYADHYDLQANGGLGVKTYLGGAASGGTTTFGGGGGMGFNNTNAAGVTAVDATNAPTATTGIDLALPLSLIGSPTGTIRVMVLIISNSDAHSNQYLPGLPATYGNLGVGNQDYNTIAGLQYVTMNLANTTSDLAVSQTPWSFGDRTNTASSGGDWSVDSHPPVVSVPTVYNGRAYCVEDVVNNTGTVHTGLLVSVQTANGILDLAFGSGGRVALDAPVTGRVAVRNVNGTDRLFVVTTAGTLYSMNASDGGNIHSLALGGTTSSTPAVMASGSTAEIYVPVGISGTWYLKKVTDTTTMTASGSLTLTGVTSVTSSPSIIRDGTRVQVCGTAGTTGVVVTASADLSTVFNTAATTNPVSASTTLASDSSVFYVGDAPASGSGKLYCFNASTGTPVSGFGTAGALSVNGGIQHAVFADYSVHEVTNALYFVTSTGNVYAVTPSTGAILPGFGGAPFGPLAATGSVMLLNGKIYVPTANGMYAVTASTPSLAVRFPTSSTASTPATTGRTAGSVMVTTGAHGLLNALTVQ